MGTHVAITKFAYISLTATPTRAYAKNRLQFWLFVANFYYIYTFSLNSYRLQAVLVSLTLWMWSSEVDSVIIWSFAWLCCTPSSKTYQAYATETYKCMYDKLWNSASRIRLRLAYDHIIFYMCLRPPTPLREMPTSTMINVNLLINLYVYKKISAQLRSLFYILRLYSLLCLFNASSELPKLAWNRKRQWHPGWPYFAG